jgi:hypothetical protein
VAKDVDAIDADIGVGDRQNMVPRDRGCAGAAALSSWQPHKPRGGIAGP